MTASGPDDVLIVNPSRVRPASPADVAEAERALGVRLPDEYAAYVRRWGEGLLGHLVSVVPPQALPETTRTWRERVVDYWFWDTSGAGVTPEALQQRGVLLIDTADGDEVCLDPDQPEALFVLPRDDDVATRLTGGFDAAVAWMLSGELNPWVEGWTFEAPGGRAEERRFSSVGPRLEEAVAAVAALGLHAHVVELPRRTTFFLPAVEGRLSLYQLEGEDEGVSLDFSYDDAADTEVVGRILAVLGGDA